jgi:hypothetical protein
MKEKKNGGAENETPAPKLAMDVRYSSGRGWIFPMNPASL